MSSYLDHLGIANNTDKASLDRQKPNSLSSPRPGHDYLRKYEFFLHRYQTLDSCSFMELGAGPNWNLGASAKVWKSYFWRPDFRLTIVDNKDTARSLVDNRTRVIVGDLGDASLLTTLASSLYHIIIDDASHWWEHQITAFDALFPSLVRGGLYIIEDIHTSFGDYQSGWSRGYPNDPFSAFSGLSALVSGCGRDHQLIASSRVNELNLGRHMQEIDGVVFIGEACIVLKKGFF